MSNRPRPLFENLQENLKQIPTASLPTVSMSQKYTVPILLTDWLTRYDATKTK